MRFVLNGAPQWLDAETVIGRLADVSPEPVREYGVRVASVVYPVKQAFEVAAGVSRREFTSQTAVRHLRTLSFTITDSVGPTADVHAPAARVSGPVGVASRKWPWEGAVQAVFVDILERCGWQITATADTATKAPGVDVLAVNGERRLGAEVKGWPSDGYADPRRAAEVKPTPPSTQAGHWFSQALFKAMLLLDSHPGHESVMVLPDFPRYRDLTNRTTTGRRAAGIHVVLLRPDGTFAAQRWSP